MQLHNLATTFRGSLGSQLISRVPSDYGFNTVDQSVKDSIVRELLMSGNLAYKKVFFDDGGAVKLASDKVCLSSFLFFFFITKSLAVYHPSHRSFPAPSP
jgi:hypothetical protein